RTGHRHLTEVLVRHGHGAVDQVAPTVGQLIVHAADELVPGEVGVVVLRAGHRDEVAQRVGTELGEEILDVDDHALGGGELGAGHGEELGGDHLGGQVQLPQVPDFSPTGALACVTEQFGGPDL